MQERIEAALKAIAAWREDDEAGCYDLIGLINELLEPLLIDLSHIAAIRERDELILQHERLIAARGSGDDAAS